MCKYEYYPQRPSPFRKKHHQSIYFTAFESLCNSTRKNWNSMHNNWMKLKLFLYYCHIGGDDDGSVWSYSCWAIMSASSLAASTLPYFKWFAFVLSCVAKNVSIKRTAVWFFNATFCLTGKSLIQWRANNVLLCRNDDPKWLEKTMVKFWSV